LPPQRSPGSIAFLVCGMLQSTAVAAPAGSVEDMAAATIRDLGLQAQLPTYEPPHEFAIQLPEVILWAVVAIAVAVLLYYLKDLRWRSRLDAEHLAAARSGAEGDTEDHLRHAEHLAQQGLFVQAMHELLLQGLRDIRERAGERVADSLTSREILRKAPLPAQGMTSLRDIIMRVEWTYFGAHPATEVDYQACRKSFDTLYTVLHPAASA
jgi:hypothetical protein